MRHSARFAGVVLSILASSQVGPAAFSPTFAEGATQPTSHTICLTEEIWQAKRAAVGPGPSWSVCATAGVCDEPGVRDRAPTEAMTLRIVFHILVRSDGLSPHGVERSTVLAQMRTLEKAFEPHRIDFQLVDIFVHRDDAYACLPSYSRFDRAWLRAIDGMKRRYARDPEENLNVFVACQDEGFSGTLLGLATFPWDPDALTPSGGIWVNAEFLGDGHKTLVHEIGHNLGLWHTHHGVDESVGCADPCYEKAHGAQDSVADRVGDFCKDTPATPVNFSCASPLGTDCTGTPWGRTEPTNYMGYGPDSCVDHFSREQGRRMHCWTRGAIAGHVQSVVVSGVQARRQRAAADDGKPPLSSQALSRVPTRARPRPKSDDLNPRSPRVALDLAIAQDQHGRYGEGWVTVTDPEGNPLPNVTIQALWTGSTSRYQLAVTGSDGRVRLYSQQTQAWPSRWQLSIRDLYREDGTNLRTAVLPLTAATKGVIRAPRIRNSRTKL